MPGPGELQVQVARPAGTRAVTAVNPGPGAPRLEGELLALILNLNLRQLASVPVICTATAPAVTASDSELRLQGPLQAPNPGKAAKAAAAMPLRQQRLGVRLQWAQFAAQL